MSGNKTAAFVLACVLGIVVFSGLGNLLASKEVVQWKGDLAAAKQEAAAQNKPLLVYFTATWCPPCQRMKTTTFADEQVNKALEKYVVAKIDVDENAEAAKQFSVNSIPAFYIVSPEGKVLRNTVGYYPPDKFIAWLNEK